MYVQVSLNKFQGNVERSFFFTFNTYPFMMICLLHFVVRAWEKEVDYPVVHFCKISVKSYFLFCFCTIVVICFALAQISEIKIAEIPDIDLSNVGVTKFGSFSVEVIDPVSDYMELLEVKIICLPLL